MNLCGVSPEIVQNCLENRAILYTAIHAPIRFFSQSPAKRCRYHKGFQGVEKKQTLMGV
jgi:hypothetical protein